ncbi:MAG: helix-turn-helix domain-containing protein [Planctomycetota bacterium]|jgi:hypothetical protein
MTRPLNPTAATQAGRALLDWANQHEPGALQALAEDLGINYRTLRRWISGEGEPSITQAIALKRLAKVPIKAWVK